MNIVAYLKSFRIRNFSNGEMLVSSGEPNSVLHAIREGFVKVSVLDEAGRQKLLWIAGRYNSCNNV